MKKSEEEEKKPKPRFLVCMITGELAPPDLYPPPKWALVKISQATPQGLVAMVEGVVSPEGLKKIPLARTNSGPVEKEDEKEDDEEGDADSEGE